MKKQNYKLEYDTWKDYFNGVFKQYSIPRLAYIMYLGGLGAGKTINFNKVFGRHYAADEFIESLDRLIASAFSDKNSVFLAYQKGDSSKKRPYAIVQGSAYKKFGIDYGGLKGALAITKLLAQDFISPGTRGKGFTEFHWHGMTAYDSDYDKMPYEETLAGKLGIDRAEPLEPMEQVCLTIGSAGVGGKNIYSGTGLDYAILHPKYNNGYIRFKDDYDFSRFSFVEKLGQDALTWPHKVKEPMKPLKFTFLYEFPAGKDEDYLTFIERGKVVQDKWEYLEDLNQGGGDTVSVSRRGHKAWNSSPFVLPKDSPAPEDINADYSKMPKDVKVARSIQAELDKEEKEYQEDLDAFLGGSWRIDERIMQISKERVKQLIRESIARNIKNRQ